MRPHYLATIVAVWLSLLVTPAAHADKRVALVIGNGNYQNTQRLPNPANDAADIAAALKRTGFETIVGLDLDKAGMESATIQFARAARDADVAIFYYSGHAMQFNGVNYLMPVDARLSDEADLRRMARVDEIAEDVQRAKNLRILVLDSCRNNPLAEQLKRSIGRTRSAGIQNGLAKMDAPQGMIVAYSTQSGREAADGTGRNSPYTAAFLKHIEAPEEIGTVFRKISADVYENTKRDQLPELSLSFIGEFYLKGRPTNSGISATEFAALQEQNRAMQEQLRKLDDANKKSGDSTALKTEKPNQVVGPKSVLPVPPPVQQKQVAALSNDRLSDLARPDARDFPNKPIAFVVPFSPGGSTDLLGRVIAQNLTSILGQPVVVENRAGAGGTIGASAVARAAPDGYTLLMGNLQTNAIATSLNSNLPYNPEKDFEPVSLVASSPIFLLVNKDVPAKNLREFSAYLKANPGRLLAGNTGVASLSQVSCGLLVSALGGTATEIPYRGSAAALTDVMAGRTQFMCDTAVTAGPLVKAGSIKMLAVAADERSADFPDVPTAAEAGFPAFKASNWNAIFAARGTPPAIVAKLSAAIYKALEDPKVKSAFASMGAAVPNPDRTTPSFLGEFVKSEIALWKPIVKP